MIVLRIAMQFLGIVLVAALMIFIVVADASWLTVEVIVALAVVVLVLSYLRRVLYRPAT